MSVAGYLDDTFADKIPHSIQSLLESESARLRQRNEYLSEEMAQERQMAADAHEQAIAQLQSFYDTVKTSAFQSVPSDRDLKDHLAPLSHDSVFADSTKSQFSALQTLAKAYQVLSRTRKVLVAEQEIADGSKDGLDLYNELLPDEKALKVFAGSSVPIVAALAIQGLEKFERSIRAKLQTDYAQKLRGCLERANWPKQESKATLSSDPEFSKLVHTLMSIEPPIEIANKEPSPLVVFDLLAEPLNVRFQFHFEGSRDTNRDDRPEWAFNHFLSVIDENYDFLAGSVQTIISRVGNRSAVHEFISATLPPVRRKLRSMFPNVMHSPPLLSHLIYETVTFDDQLSERYYFTPYGRDTWRGVAGDLLSNSSWFEAWLNSEKVASFERYTEIIESKDAFNIDWESVEQSETKPTKSAINLKDLIEGVTERYSPLRSAYQRLRFLLNIQIELLDKYYSRLKDSIDAFDSMASSSLVRSIGGGPDTTSVVTGINGLERLCRIYGSLDYISQALQAWGQDLFFLEIWEDISKRTSRLDSKVKQAVSDTSANVPTSESQEGTLFDETVTSYEALKKRVQLTINSVLKKEMRSSLQDYVRSSQWKPEQAPASGQVSSRLAHPVKTLSADLSFLAKFYSPIDFVPVCRQFTADISRYLWDYVLNANQFNAFGAVQLSNDISELWTSLNLPRDKSYRRLEQASTVLNQDGDLKSLQEDPAISDLDTNEIYGLLQRRQR